MFVAYVNKRKTPPEKPCPPPCKYCQTLPMATKRKVYITLSEFATKIVDLLPSNKGRQSLVLGLIEAYKLIDLCDGTIDIYPLKLKILQHITTTSLLNI